MQIPYSYLEDEVKDGFYVNSMMKCCWAAQMNILDQIDRICRKHNIQYQAEWGTLLGVVRHGGYIPWDDDLDISMKREDYNKFTKIALKELPEGYFFRNYATDKDYWDVISRIVNTRKFHFDNDFLEKNYYYPFPAGVDIFPLDYIPMQKKEGDALKELIFSVKSVADTYVAGYFSEEEFEMRLQMVEKGFHKKIPRDEKVLERLYDIVVSLYAMYGKEDTEQIGHISQWMENGSNSYPKEYYSKISSLSFETITMPVPIAYDSMLKQRYGDYMKMVRKGGSHDYPQYKKHFELMKKWGIELNRFEYSKRQVRKEEKTVKSGLGGDNLKLLEKIHFTLYKLLMAGDRETVMQMLIKCQDCAVSLGEKIENIASKCEEIITTLEEYCELIFQIYQLLDSGEELNPEDMFRILQEQLQATYDVYEKEYKQKKKIVFIIDKAARWNSFGSVWHAAKEDENNIVSVIPVPYYYKRIDNSIIEEHYEGDMFPEYVDIVDYRTCNLEQHHPDVIYINSPYDEYNYFTSIHQGFYSSKLINCCDKLVYIPWFMLTELTREDERGWQSMQHFVTMPGVVHADQVIVQSEQMRQAYVDYLTDWAGEDTRGIWEEKICGFGSPLMDKQDDREEIENLLPESWKSCLYKENGERKKVILYSMSSASFIDYKEKAVDKLKRVLVIFKENKDDICLLWYWDVVMEETLKTNYPALWTEFCQIVQGYREEAWGIFEIEADRELMVRFSDAYYGDGSAVSQAMVMVKKPVMLENFEC